MSRLSRNLRMFHGRPVRRSRTVTLNDVKGLIELGRIVAVEYECDKWNGGGDGTTAVYRHEFDRPVVLAADQTMRRQLYILGSSIRVTDAGVEG